MKPQEAIEFINNEMQIDVRFCTDEMITKTQEAFKLAISALEKQIPQKVVQERITEALKPNCCPVCNNRHYEILVPYCRFCGQALDWSDIE